MLLIGGGDSLRCELGGGDGDRRRYEEVKCDEEVDVYERGDRRTLRREWLLVLVLTYVRSLLRDLERRRSRVLRSSSFDL